MDGIRGGRTRCPRGDLGQERVIVELTAPAGPAVHGGKPDGNPRGAPCGE